MEAKAVKQRQSNIELIRIIAMLMIVGNHYSLYGFVKETTDFPFMSDMFVVDALRAGGKLGVDIFVIISAYFMVKKRFTLRRFLKLEGQIWFYSVGILAAMLWVVPHSEFVNYPQTWPGYFQRFFPTLYGFNWYPTCFVYLMLISPVLNEMLHKIPRQKMKMILLTVIILCAVFPVAGRTSLQLGNLGQMVIVYMIGGYIRLYKSDGVNPKAARRHLLAAILFTVLVVLMKIYDPKYRHMNSILVYAVSVELLMWGITSKPFYSRFINTVAATTFGVYLYHDDYLPRPYFWKDVFQNTAHYGTGHLIVHAVTTIAIVFAVGSLIDFIRLKTLEPLWMKVVDGGLEDKIKQVARESWDYFVTITAPISRYMRGEPAGADGSSVIEAGITAFILTLIGILPTMVTVPSRDVNGTSKIYALIEYGSKGVLLYALLAIGLGYIFLRIHQHGAWKDKAVLTHLLGAILTGVLIFILHKTNYIAACTNFLTDDKKGYFIIWLVQMEACVWMRHLSITE